MPKETNTTFSLEGILDFFLHNLTLKSDKKTHERQQSFG
jgi:hypothetical protein